MKKIIFSLLFLLGLFVAVSVIGGNVHAAATCGAPDYKATVSINAKKCTNQGTAAAPYYICDDDGAWECNKSDISCDGRVNGTVGNCHYSGDGYPTPCTAIAYGPKFGCNISADFKTCNVIPGTKTVGCWVIEATPTPTPGKGGCGDTCAITEDCSSGFVCAPAKVCWKSDCGPTATPPARCSKPNKPTLQSPDNNAKKPDKTPTFNWSDVNKPAGCNSVKYDIQVKEGSATGTNIINKSDLNNSTCTAGSAPCQFVSGKSMVAGKSYFWQVRASTSKGNSDWAGPWKYTVTAGPTVTPGGPTLTPTPGGPTPTDNPNCICRTSNVCSNSCTFDKFASGINYNDPIKCDLASSFFPTPPTAANKTSWCQATKRTKGDADGNNVINNADYFYYVAAVLGGKIPVTVNPDFNGDDEVGAADRTIIIKSLNP